MKIENNTVIMVDDSDIINGVVTLPEHVTAIGDSAFLYCSQKFSLIIPPSFTSIGDSAFADCRTLSAITIPNSVKSIGFNAFYGCICLRSVNIPGSVTSIGRYAFASCPYLRFVTIAVGAISIGDYAFADCRYLTEVTIPASVTSIGKEVFNNGYDYSLLSIIIYTQNQKTFNRIIRPLPGYNKAMVDLNRQRFFNDMTCPIRDFINPNPNKITEINMTDIEKLFADAEDHLEKIKSYDWIYHERRKDINFLLFQFYLLQSNQESTIRDFQKHRNSDEKTSLFWASLCFALEHNNFLQKHKALIYFFKEIYKIKEINFLLTRAVLNCLNGGEARIDDTLQQHDIDRCVPLAEIKQLLKHVIGEMDDNSQLKVLLKSTQDQLHLLTHQEMKKLLSMSPLKEVFVKEFGGTKILPFESFYLLQPPLSELPEDAQHFLTMTLHLIAVEKRAETNTNDAAAAQCVSALLAQLKSEVIPDPPQIDESLALQQDKLREENEISKRFSVAYAKQCKKEWVVSPFSSMWKKIKKNEHITVQEITGHALSDPKSRTAQVAKSLGLKLH